MNLTPREKDKLLVAVAAMVARRRRERGVKLNHPEAVALITDFVMEGARDGKRLVADLMCDAQGLLTTDDVMPGVPEMIEYVQVEATFPDGTKLVTVHSPILRPKAGIMPVEEPGAEPGVMPVEAFGAEPGVESGEEPVEEPPVDTGLNPGEIICKDEEIEVNPGREIVTVDVLNTGDRPIQVGSHYHFYEVNSALQFDREKARGMRLDIPAGTARRFEPSRGMKRFTPVNLVPIGGARIVTGFRGDINGKL